MRALLPSAVVLASLQLHFMDMSSGGSRQVLCQETETLLVLYTEKGDHKAAAYRPWAQSGVSKGARPGKRADCCSNCN